MYLHDGLWEGTGMVSRVQELELTQQKFPRNWQQHGLLGGCFTVRWCAVREYVCMYSVQCGRTRG